VYDVMVLQSYWSAPFWTFACTLAGKLWPPVTFLKSASVIDVGHCCADRT
jgi:hypothetical protein